MEQREPQEIRYDGVHCNLILRQFPPSVVVLGISGSDIGEFGEAPMMALNDWLTGSQTIEFFIDARDVRGASIEVSGQWAKWLSGHKAELRVITMLTGSHYIRITAEFVRRYAALEGIMRICTEPAVFESALAEALQQH